MGQYWYPVNLDKREMITPHKLGAGLKLWEQLAGRPGTAAALVILLAAEREARGGGDFDLEHNWHGPERTFPEHSITPGPMPEDYRVVAARTIGRWAGDRIALVGDYAEDSDLPPEFEAGSIYKRCSEEGHYEYNSVQEGSSYKDMSGGEHHGLYAHWIVDEEPEFKDITDDVARVIEHELRGHFTGDGWRDFKDDED